MIEILLKEIILRIDWWYKMTNEESSKIIIHNYLYVEKYKEKLKNI